MNWWNEDIKNRPEVHNIIQVGTADDADDYNFSETSLYSDCYDII